MFIFSIIFSQKKTQTSTNYYSHKNTISLVVFWLRYPQKAATIEEKSWGGDEKANELGTIKPNWVETL